MIIGRGGTIAVSGSYRPFLDGLRAVAVYLVVLFHAGSDRFVGGFVGVDVFFVLSGFLVTQLLLRDVSSVGRVGFGRFYARRFRRLLPAAFVALVVTAMVFSALASPVEVADAVGGFKASFLYSANWYFVSQSADYFGADLATNPVLHFWSLAVEEQFYLVWPLLLSGLFVLCRRFGTRQWPILRAVVALGAVASMVWAWSLRDVDPNRAYYGTDTRAYQLMAGALVALTPGLISSLARFARPARWVGLGALGALVLVASSWVHIDPIERGIAVTAITVALILSLETAQAGALHRVLSTGPVVYLGKISYATYLWHWPVIVVITRSFDLAPITTIALTVLVATALASLSFQLLEHPIRISALLDRHRYPVIATGLALSLTSALVIIPTITTGTTTAAPGTTNLATTGFTPVPNNLDFKAISTDYPPSFLNCYGKPAAACTIVQGTGQHILLIGDSHAAMMVPTFKAMAERENLRLSVAVRGGCPWQRDLYVRPLILFGKQQRLEDCKRPKEDAYDRVIPALRPDIVVGMNLAYEIPELNVGYRTAQAGGPAPGSGELAALLERTTRDAIAKLTSLGGKLVVLEPIPQSTAKFNSVTCLSTAIVVERCRYVTQTEPTGLERLYRQLDRDSDQVWSFDLDKLVCPFLPICDPIVEHQVVKMDATHLSSAFAVSLAPALTDLFRANGVIP